LKEARNLEPGARIWTAGGQRAEFERRYFVARKKILLDDSKICFIMSGHS
jgi:hypothetical protein